MYRTVFAAAAASSLLLAAGAAQAVELQFLRSWSERYLGTEQMADEYARMIEDASGGEITVNLIGPDTVPPFEQLEPVQAGAFDMLFTHGAYHAGTTTLVIGVDTVDPDPVVRRESGVWDFIDEHYQGLGLKLLAMPASGGSHFMLREPLPESGDFQGLKVRATPPMHPLIEAMGGSPIVLPGGEIYSALDKGVVDAANWPVAGALAFKWYEVADYYIRPQFGKTTHPILINLDTWNSLSKEHQDLMLEAGLQIEHHAREVFDQIESDEEAKLKEFGMERLEWTGNLWEKARNAFVDGYWAVAAKQDAEKAEALRKMSADQGLLFNQ